MKIIGLIMTIVAGLIILYNVTTAKDNHQQIEESPLSTILSGGTNLKQSYSFTPPFTGFEITVIVAVVIGIGLIIFGSSSTEINKLQSIEDQLNEFSARLNKTANNTDEKSELTGLNKTPQQVNKTTNNTDEESEPAGLWGILTFTEFKFPLIGKNRKLTQSIGIKEPTGTFKPILEKGMTVPCSTSLIESMDQGELMVELYQGTATLVTGCDYLGRLRIFSNNFILPTIEIRFTIYDGKLLLSARNHATNALIKLSNDKC